MSKDADDATVTAPSGTATVTAEMKQELQKIVMGIVKEIVPRTIKQSLSEQSDTLLDQLADKMIQSAAGDDPAPANGGEQTQEKLSLKALQQKLDEMQRGIKERDEQIKTERQNAMNLRLRSDVQSHFARHLGADSPHLEPYVNHFLSQFVDHEGKTARKTKNDYGEDTYLPAAQAIDEMFKGDLKHLVQQSKANALPNAGLVRGQPFNGQPQGGKRPGFVEQAMNHLATTNPDLAPLIAPNGTPQK